MDFPNMDFSENILSGNTLKAHDYAHDLRFSPVDFDFVTPVRSVSSNAMNVYERENWVIANDHCYARPWNWRPETNFLRPTKSLFVSKPHTNKRKSINPLAPLQESDEYIDVETEVLKPSPIYDVVNAKQMMTECSRHANLARGDKNEDWEENISRVNWIPSQYKLFNSMVSILNNFHMASLAQIDAHNEPLLRRSIIDKSVQRVRRLLASVSWEPKIIQWLHGLLIDNLSSDYLGAYLDILQTLRSKLPTFVDKMLAGGPKLGPLGIDTLYPLLKKQWDPVASSLMQDKPKKLPGNPIIIVVPSAPVTSNRIQNWIALLSNLATVITIPTNFGSAGHRMSMINHIDHMFATTKAKILDIKANYPGRHIILVGFNAGGTLALHIAQIEPVLCVICLGFSLLTAEGHRGEPDDILLDLQSPVLFVIGQCSNTTLQEDMEDLRERMRVETGLIVVGSADDCLRVKKKKQKAEGITQSVIDRCVVDEIGEFISGVILSPFSPIIRQSPVLGGSEISAKKSKTERKRHSSNASSLDSDAPSPTPKIPRSSTGPPNTNASIRPSPVPFVQSGGIKTIPPQNKSPASSIKVLENVTLNSNSTQILSSSGKTIDLSKITLLHPGKVGKPLGNVILLPDGKIRTEHGGNIVNTNPLFVPVSNPNKVGRPSLSFPLHQVKGSRGKYITSKRQLIGNKPPRPPKKRCIQASTFSTHLPPPTNLTTQDIMDLPIIFADDNQLLDNTVSTEVISAPPPPSIPLTQASKILTSQPGKFVLVNKQLANASNFIISPASLKKPVTINKQPPKYTKIILSKRTGNEEGKPVNSNIIAKITNLPSDISIRKISPMLEKPGSSNMVLDNSTPTLKPTMENIDLENELVATAVPKPNLATSDVKNITIINKNIDETLQTEDVNEK